MGWGVSTTALPDDSYFVTSPYQVTREAAVLTERRNRVSPQTDHAFLPGGRERMQADRGLISAGKGPVRADGGPM